MNDMQKHTKYKELLEKLDRAKYLAQFIVDGIIANSKKKAA